MHSTQFFRHIFRIDSHSTALRIATTLDKGSYSRNCNTTNNLLKIIKVLPKNYTFLPIYKTLIDRDSVYELKSSCKNVFIQSKVLQTANLPRRHSNTLQPVEVKVFSQQSPVFQICLSSNTLSTGIYVERYNILDMGETIQWILKLL